MSSRYCYQYHACHYNPQQQTHHSVLINSQNPLSNMRLLSFFALAAPLVSAIDIQMWTDDNCSGIGYLWTRVEPNDCFGNENNIFRSGRWFWIPREWNIITRVYSDGYCNRERGAVQSNSNTEGMLMTKESNIPFSYNRCSGRVPLLVKS